MDFSAIATSLIDQITSYATENAETWEDVIDYHATLVTALGYSIGAAHAIDPDKDNVKALVTALTGTFIEAAEAGYDKSQPAVAAFRRTWGH